MSVIGIVYNEVLYWALLNKCFQFTYMCSYQYLLHRCILYILQWLRVANNRYVFRLPSLQLWVDLFYVDHFYFFRIFKLCFDFHYHTEIIYCFYSLTILRIIFFCALNIFFLASLNYRRTHLRLSTKIIQFSFLLKCFW